MGKYIWRYSQQLVGTIRGDVLKYLDERRTLAKECAKLVDEEMGRDSLFSTVIILKYNVRDEIQVSLSIEYPKPCLNRGNNGYCGIEYHYTPKGVLVAIDFKLDETIVYEISKQITTFLGDKQYCIWNSEIKEIYRTYPY